MEVILLIETEIDKIGITIDEAEQYYKLLFKKYPDVLGTKELKEMLGIGFNRVY